MEKEDEESKNLKNKNLAGRKTRKEATIYQVILDIFLIVILENFITLLHFVNWFNNNILCLNKGYEKIS